jgi:hypothetical protein
MFGAHPMFRIGGAAGYQIPYSLRFRRSNNAAMTRTAGTPTNAKIATWSFWHKRGALGPEWVWGESTGGASTFFSFDNGAPDTIRILVRGASLTSTPVFRDPSAWYHFVVAVDTTQATAADRIKVYANNQAVTMSGTITLNADITWNESGKSIKISNGAGWFATSADYIDGYLAEFNFIDGQALTPSSFGQTDATTGVWVPKKYSGTYGSNGFYLKFADATSTTTIGNDSSGNANNWTTSGISVTSGVTFDQMLDTPTLNYSTGNAVFVPSTNFLVDFRAANLEWGQAASNKNCSGVASIEMRTGKWYWETTVGTVAGSITFGVSRSDLNSSFRGTGTVYYRQDGQKVVDGVASAYGASYVANDVLGFAYDADAGTLTCYKNNTSQGTITITSGSSYGWFPACALDNAGAGVTAFHTFNFGQRPFSYTPPSGFKALNTQNVTSTAVTLSGSFTGNAAADGPFIWTNGNPATLTINGNGVTFGTDADKTAGGFKLRTSSASYNAAGTNNWTATAGKRFVQARKPNNAQVNP